MSGPETCDVCDRFIEEDDGMVVAHEDCLDPDDARDGRALRLLREAVPTDTGQPFVQVFSPYLDGSDDRWDVSVIGDHTDPSWRGTGSTLAEAADACRAALEARS